MKKNVLPFVLPKNPEIRILQPGEYHRMAGASGTTHFAANQFHNYQGCSINPRGSVIGPNKKAIANTRFSPVLDNNNNFVPTLYIGETYRCAHAETLLRVKTSQTLTLKACENRSRYTLQLDKPLKLLNLAPPVIQGNANNDYKINGVDLLESDQTWYKNTCHFASRAYCEYPDIAGLYWGSRQIHNHSSMILFESRLQGATLTVTGEFKMLDPSEMQNWLMDAALVGITPDAALLKLIASIPAVANIQRFF